MLSALRVIAQPLTAQRLLFFGAGEAATGMADLSLMALGLVSDERAWSNVTLPPK